MASGERSIVAKLLIISVLSLFCEMLVIRWLATEVRIFAYFKNLPLIAAFLGLGLGFLLSDRKVDMMKASSYCLLYFCGLMVSAIVLQLTHLTFVDNSQIMLFGDYGDGGAIGLDRTFVNVLVMVAIFGLATMIFVGMGQETGKLFDRLKPLEAYSINVAGGLIGIILFSLLSNFQLGPGVWVIVAGLLMIGWEQQLKRCLPAVLLIILGLVYQFYLSSLLGEQLYGANYVTTVWSPYYRVDVRKAVGSFAGQEFVIGGEIYINYDSFQTMLDCRHETLKKLPSKVQTDMRNQFEAPFLIAGRKENPEILILGCGSGSDVAAALRCGAGHVDAVDIDKSIVNLGRELHPEKPYDSPKVDVHIMDARTFLKNSKKKYDIVEYAILDSHTAFSSLSSLRTDNYIFTTESYKDASKLLKDDGYIVANFVNHPQWLFDRHAKDLYLATNQIPIGWRWQTTFPAGCLVAGPGVTDASKLQFPGNLQKVDLNSDIPPITDDWPFLFLPKREVPLIYVLPVVVAFVFAVLPVATLLVKGRGTPSNWQMLLLGMGFMLLEVRAMSSMSLLCGATWTVNSIVISGVMIAILLANVIAGKLKTQPAILIGLVLVMIFASSFLDVSSLNSLPTEAGVAIGTIVFLSPLFFAAILFGALFKQVTSASQALSFNMIGGVIGITVEYLSMAFGIKSLSYFAMAIYGLVVVFELLKTKESTVAVEDKGTATL